MGLLLGAGVCSCLEIKKPNDLIVPFTIALFLAVVKETGFLLSLLIVLLIVIKIIREKIFLSKWLLFCLACLGLMFVNFQLWQIHLKQDPLLPTFNSAGIWLQLKSDLASMSLRTRDTLSTFFKALYNRPIGRSFLSRIPLPLFQYIKGFYLFWVALLAFVFIYAKSKAEYLITYFWGLIGYTFVLVITFLYFFGEYEGRILASYERYVGVYFLAFSLVAIKLIYDQKLFENRTFKNCLIGLIVIFPPSPRILYPPSIKYIFPEKILMKFKADHNTRLDIASIKDKIVKSTPPNSKIWFIWQNSVGYEAMIVRYEIAPRKMNVSGWSVGAKYYAGDVWTFPDDIESLSHRFAQMDYVALGSIDEQFIQRYKNLFVTTPRTGSVYKKEMINNELRWMEI